ncbi:MAG: SDR family oxidoreductase [Solobacterium sp.]|nr:SDR family oxidoreductase [Solobacterium sp.]MCI7731655.1 SDR family oxidoreductase [Solobacterium sp.]MDD6956438.1 SDR family oxidoreductase [Solobacterium sp.]MDY4641219.1 SDR family oxidoreductase [Erysipelotrichaceae bacterium]MDY5652633.1 SDR family oxidoreductase [Erysipelotrichaceae bacterium]
MKYALVTGASSGIGKEMAYLLAEEKYDLILVARREKLLNEIRDDIVHKYGVDVHVLSIDVSLGYKDIYDYCINRKIVVDILINNAGFGYYGRCLEADEKVYEKMIDLNNKALVALCQLFGKDMAKRHKGHILNVASVAGFMPGPYMSVYYASKAFVLNYTLGLRQELKKEGVGVSALCPAPTASEFWDVAGVKGSSVYSLFSRTSKQAARTGMKCIKYNRPYMIDGLLYKLMIQLCHLLPVGFSAWIMGIVQSRIKG